MGACGPCGFHGVGWEILNRGVTGSALYFKTQSGCCVEIILKCNKSENKKTTLKAIRMVCARDDCGLGHHFVEWGELQHTNGFRSREPRKGRHAVISSCASHLCLYHLLLDGSPSIIPASQSLLLYGLLFQAVSSLSHFIFPL